MKKPVHIALWIAVALCLIAIGGLIGIGVSAVTAETPAPSAPVTVTRNVTPEDCLKALDTTEDITSGYGEVIQAVSEYPKLVTDAAEAGTRMDADALYEISDRMEEITEVIERVTEETEPNINDYVVQAARCRG